MSFLNLNENLLEINNKKDLKFDDHHPSVKNIDSLNIQTSFTKVIKNNSFKNHDINKDRDNNILKDEIIEELHLKGDSFILNSYKDNIFQEVFKSLGFEYISAEGR
jgi:hypothetical protein